MIKINYKDLPGDNNFFLDYIADKPEALNFFSYNQRQLRIVLSARNNFVRPPVSKIILEYNDRIGAPKEVLDNASRLDDKNVFTLISGQQAGFLGGPLYSVYKIITTINISRNLNNEFPSYHFIPIFWLASEDHDFYEINHVNFIKDDGEVGKLQFDWKEKGKSLYDLIVTKEMADLVEIYLKSLPPAPGFGRISRILRPYCGEKYTEWTARIFSNLFGKEGLVIVEPPLLRPLAADLNYRILKNYSSLLNILEETNSSLINKNYKPLIPSEKLDIFTYDDRGYRVKVKPLTDNLTFLEKRPDLFSPGALLRPVWADYILPNVMSVLGSSELAYHGQLKGFYDFLDVSQPVITPRQSYTLASVNEAETMEKYNIKSEDIFPNMNNLGVFFEKLVPVEHKKLFRDVRKNISTELKKLTNELEKIDPNLLKTLQNSSDKIQYSLNKLEFKAGKSLLARKGYYPKELKELENILFPMGNLQERIFPFFYFLSLWNGDELEDILLSNNDYKDFRHNFLIQGL